MKIELTQRDDDRFEATAESLDGSKTVTTVYETGADACAHIGLVLVDESMKALQAQLDAEKETVEHLRQRLLAYREHRDDAYRSRQLWMQRCFDRADQVGKLKEKVEKLERARDQWQRMYYKRLAAYFDLKNTAAA